VKGYAPDVPLIGEITAGPVDATEYLLGDELDGVMNYRFRQIALGFARSTNWTDSSGTIRALSARETAHAIEAVLADYPPQAAAVSFNLIDSHDTNRALFVLTEPPIIPAQRLRLAALLQFTTVGAPMVYYGDEVAINAPGKGGFGDPYNRAPYPWPDASGDVHTYGPQDIQTLIFYSQLASVRHSLAALRSGSLVTLFANSDVYVFARVAPPNKPVVVALNKSSGDPQVTIPLKGLYSAGVLADQLTGDTFSVSGGKVRVTVPARSGRILVGTS
jgi:glycosidase